MHRRRETLDIKPILLLATALTLSGCSRDAGEAMSGTSRDPRQGFDPERARVAALRIAGVRSAAWVDERHLLAVVEQNAQRTEHTIGQICRELDALGDVQTVVVNLQSAAATTARELLVLSRDCAGAQAAHPRPDSARSAERARSPARSQHRENDRR